MASLPCNRRDDNCSEWEQIEHEQRGDASIGGDGGIYFVVGGNRTGVCEEVGTVDVARRSSGEEVAEDGWY